MMNSESRSSDSDPDWLSKQKTRRVRKIFGVTRKDESIIKKEERDWGKSCQGLFLSLRNRTQGSGKSRSNQGEKKKKKAQRGQN